MSDLSAYGSSIQGLKEQAQSCRVGRSSPPHPPHLSSVRYMQPLTITSSD